jgi:hypothetical protein
MLKDLDDCCTEAGIWPHAVLSAHSHNYQRYARTISNNRMIPYFVVGTGGIGTQNIPAPIGAKSPDGSVRYANAVQSHGFLTTSVSRDRLALTFTAAVDTHRSIFETITMDFATGQQI